MADYDLPSLLIAPNRKLAEEFLATVARVRAFQILGDLKSYPSAQALGMRLRQYEPEVVLLDVSGGLAAVSELIGAALRERPGIQIIGLGAHPDPELIIGVLRLGASEFLYSPFRMDAQQEAVSRLRRLRRPARPAERSAGKVIAVASAKPGSGATTLAVELALALERLSSSRVLLIDADLAAGTLGAGADGAPRAGAGGEMSLIEALEGGVAGNWHRRTSRQGAIELLPAPPEAFSGVVNLLGWSEMLEQARAAFDWVVTDLPVLFDRVSLTALAPADCYLLVTTPELPSLHLTKRALALLDALGCARQSVRVVVNQASKREGLGLADFQKIFSQPLAAMLPVDRISINRRQADGTLFRPLGPESEFGRGVERLARQLSAYLQQENARSLPEGQAT